MSPPPQTPPALRIRSFVTATAVLLAGGFLIFGALAPVSATNTGTIKVHEASEVGDESNDPHVACPFYFEGFGMAATSGSITVKAWPPTGDTHVVLNTTWTASDDNETADHHFLAGPFSLPSGHYKAFISNAPDHEKMKAFWVDCEGVPTPPPCDGTIALTGYHYFVLNGVNYTHLADIPLHAGDDVTVVFTLQGCGEKTLSFVSYNATSDFNLPDQTVFGSDTGSFTEGTHTMDVIVPPCYYQLDFVFGAAIENFNPDGGVTYHDEGRFIDGTQAGQACETHTTTSTTTGTTTTSIPFFPSGMAVALGMGGALAGTLVVLRRRL